MKLGTGPAEVLKPGQLREKRKSSLAIGPQRSGTWHKERSTVAACQRPASLFGGELEGHQLMRATSLSLNPLLLPLGPDFTIESFLFLVPPHSHPHPQTAASGPRILLHGCHPIPLSATVGACRFSLLLNSRPTL